MKNIYVEEYLGGLIEDAFLYHKTVQFDRNFILSLSWPLENFIEKSILKLHVSSAMASRKLNLHVLLAVTSRKGVCCVYISIRIFY